MFYAKVIMSEHHDVLHAFISPKSRDEWIAAEPDERESGELWEVSDREILPASLAREDVEWFDGIVIHDVRSADIPAWLKDATNGNSMMSGQPMDPRHPGDETFWTNARH